MLKDFFTFRRSDRRGALALLIVGVIVLAVIHFTGLGQKDIREAIVSEAEADSLAPSPTDKPAAPVLDLQAFDPNTADSATLRSLGLSPFVASNIVKYRRAGGHFRKPTDLARIYGMDSASFNRILPYIYLEEERRPTNRPTLTLPQREGTHVRGRENDSLSASQKVLPLREDLGGSSDDLVGSSPSPYKEYMENKLPAGAILDLNRADSADLVRIPGIGPYYASQIVRLRRQLGGFVSIAQLNAIPNLPDIGDRVTIAADAQQRINVNTATLKQLKDHPYIGYYRARAIVNLREREGHIVNLRQLAFLDEFTDDDIRRLEPYLSFE